MDVMRISAKSKIKSVFKKWRRLQHKLHLKLKKSAKMSEAPPPPQVIGVVFFWKLFLNIIFICRNLRFFFHAFYEGDFWGGWVGGGVYFSNRNPVDQMLSSYICVMVCWYLFILTFLYEKLLWFTWINSACRKDLYFYGYDDC